MRTAFGLTSIGKLLLAAGVLAVLPASANAQKATLVYHLTGDLPAAGPGATGGLTNIDIQATQAVDGDMVAFQVNFGPTMMVTTPISIDLSKVRIQVILNTSTDSIAVGMVLPPELATMAGVDLGYRLDMDIPKALPNLTMLDIEALVDSAKASMENEKTRPTNTGRKSVVAGISCELWKLSPGEAQMDSVVFCLADEPAAVKAFSDAIKKALPEGSNPFAALMEEGKKRFGFDGKMPLSMEMFGEMNMKSEMISISDSSPGAAFFKLPEGLTPFPIDALMSGMAGGAPQTES